MNFSLNSVKLKSKPRNEDFYLDIETPRGHVFAVLDFTSHDYANLNATLKGKLESIVGSFASLSNFSDDLFLGFLAKEINNFVSNLAEQSGGPELFFSAALCLLSGNRLSYFLCGDIRIIHSSDSLTAPLAAASETQLGAQNLEAPMTDQVQTLTLRDDDLVLIMTQGLAEVMPADVATLRESDPKSIGASLMKGSLTSSEDRTLVVIGGPYERYLDPALPDSGSLADFKESLTSLEARLEALTGSEERRKPDAGGLEGGNAAELEQKFSQQIDSLKDELRSKAASIDLLEFDAKLKAVNALLAGKADTADVLGLQRDVLKLGLVSNPLGAAEGAPAEAIPLSLPVGSPGASATWPVSPAADARVRGYADATDPGLQTSPWLTPFNIKGVLIVVVISLVGGFVGGWFHARRPRIAEAWSVKSSGNQIVISRLDGPAREDVTMNVSSPVKSTGEQTFSSFTDVKQYVDTITSGETQSVRPDQASPGNQAAPGPDNKTSGTVSETTIKPGDTLQKLSEAYNVPPEKLKELNPTIKRWPVVQIGQKIFVPAAASTSASVPSPADPLPASQPSASPTPANTRTANTTQVRVAPGDSLNQLARRFNTSAERLKELNPNIGNWLRIQRGQKVLVPTPAGR